MDTPEASPLDEAAPEAPAPRVHNGSKVVLRAHGIRKSFAIGDRQLEVLHGVDMHVEAREKLAIVGASGAGKSTLLHILGLLDRPTEGAVLLEGRDGWKLPQDDRALLRNQKIGFVFQFYHLLPELTALENTVLPAMISNSPGAFRRAKREHYARAEEILTNFGLSKRLKHRPAQLSGGERQRVALARALFLDPVVIIADEPTGNLDSATGERVLELLFSEQEKRGFALLLVTHDDRLAAQCDRTLYMGDGQIEADTSVVVPD